jgi:hypothetical protein
MSKSYRFVQENFRLSDKRTEHVLQNSTVAVVISFTRGVDAHYSVKFNGFLACG